MKEGKVNGYSDKDIVKLITPDLYLRNILKNTENLTLYRLMKIRQSHLIKKSAKDLYQSLKLLE